MSQRHMSRVWIMKIFLTENILHHTGIGVICNWLISAGGGWRLRVEELARAHGRVAHDHNQEEGAEEEHVSWHFGGQDGDQVQDLRLDHIGNCLVNRRVLHVRVNSK